MGCPCAANAAASPSASPITPPPPPPAHPVVPEQSARSVTPPPSVSVQAAAAVASVIPSTPTRAPDQQIVLTPISPVKRREVTAKLIVGIIAKKDIEGLIHLLRRMKQEVIDCVKENAGIQDSIYRILQDKGVRDEQLMHISRDFFAALNVQQVPQTFGILNTELCLALKRLLVLLPSEALRSALDFWKLNQRVMGYGSQRLTDIPLGKMIQVTEDPDQIAAYFYHAFGNQKLGQDWLTRCLNGYPDLANAIFSELEKSPWKLSVALSKHTSYELDVAQLRDWMQGKDYPECQAILQRYEASQKFQKELEGALVLQETTMPDEDCGPYVTSTRFESHEGWKIAWELLNKTDATTQSYKSDLLAILRHPCPESLGRYFLGECLDASSVRKFLFAGILDEESRNNIVKAFHTKLISSSAFQHLETVLEMMCVSEHLPLEAKRQAAAFKIKLSDAVTQT